MTNEHTGEEYLGKDRDELRAIIVERDIAIEQLHAAVKTAQELAARRLMEIERLRKDLRECRSHLTDVITSQDRPAIKAAADWLSDWEGTRIDPGSAPEPEVGETFPSVIKAQADTIGVLARRVVRMGSPLRDHACPQCVPEGGDLVNYGFVCAYHLASYLVTCPEYQLPDASRDASSEPYPPFMYCPKCGDLYTGRGGTDGFPMTLTCPNQHSWTDPRPTELRTGEQ